MTHRNVTSFELTCPACGRGVLVYVMLAGIETRSLSLTGVRVYGIVEHPCSEAS